MEPTKPSRANGAPTSAALRDMAIELRRTATALREEARKAQTRAWRTREVSKALLRSRAR